MMDLLGRSRPVQSDHRLPEYRLLARPVWAVAAYFCLLLPMTSGGPSSAQGATAQGASAKGEPAQSFVKQLRNAGYFDTAITYLDRIAKSNTTGVQGDFIQAIPLEKAQTHIEAALHARKSEDRDQAFAAAESSLKEFLGQSSSHPRAPEARLQLGKLQMIRAAQLLVGESDQGKRELARESYLAAAATFDAIVSDLRTKLEAMQGQKIDADADPEAKTLRDLYRTQYMQSQLNAADAIKLAAKTYDKPVEQAKPQLEDAAKRFAQLNEKYFRFPPGAIALMHLGDVYEVLGDDKLALDNYLKMLEEPEVDQLREAKLLAATGLVRLKLKADPPKYQEAIDRAEAWVKEIRRNEESLPVVQDFRVAMAKAYLAKAADKDLKKGEIGRARSDGRDLLQAAKKVPGPHIDEVDTLLAELGIEQEAPELPTAEPPKSFDDAMEKATQILGTIGDLEKALGLIEAQENQDQVKQQIGDIKQQIGDSYSIGIQILRGGLAMINAQTDRETLNQARQILAYFLYQSQRHRETVVVGSFLARKAPGTETGLKGGLMALSSMQMLLAEVPDDANAGLLRQLESLGKYLARTWPDNPDAAAAQGMQIRLLLKKDDFDQAEALIAAMEQGNERAEFKRLLGQLYWNESIIAQRENADKQRIDDLVSRAKKTLTEGLNEIEGNLIEVEGMQAAGVLVKIHLRDKSYDDALNVLDHETYGPLDWVDKLKPPTPAFKGELFTSELTALVGRMLADEDPAKYLNRMTASMEKLRGAFQGPGAQTKLTERYVRLATDLKSQLDSASAERKRKLIDVFGVMLKRISDTAKDQATLRWVGQTQMSMGESLMQPNAVVAQGNAAELIQQAAESFKALEDQDNLTTAYLLGRALRLSGNFKDSIDVLDKMLQKTPLMLEGQVEAALAYEAWAGTLSPKYAPKAYTAALKGARRGPNGKNTIWGWDEISQKTSNNIKRSENFKEKFFESRYHVALCLYLLGKAAKRDKDIRNAIKVIRAVATLYPDLGGAEHRAKYDVLMKEAQRAVGDQPTGLPQPKKQ